MAAEVVSETVPDDHGWSCCGHIYDWFGSLVRQRPTLASMESSPVHPPESVELQRSDVKVDQQNIPRARAKGSLRLELQSPRPIRGKPSWIPARPPTPKNAQCQDKRVVASEVPAVHVTTRRPVRSVEAHELKPVRPNNTRPSSAPVARRPTKAKQVPDKEDAEWDMLDKDVI